MIQLTFYVPENHLEQVKDAVFAAGGGRIGDYEHCCWQVLGQGQFRPGANASPFVGERGEIAKVAEYRVEMVCEDAKIEAAIAALRRSHPYEEPAYNALRLLEV